MHSNQFEKKDVGVDINAYLIYDGTKIRLERCFSLMIQHCSDEVSELG